MTNRARRAEAYRVRAVQLRAIAEMMKDTQARESVLTVASEYEHMAAHVEHMPPPIQRSDWR